MTTQKTETSAERAERYDAMSARLADEIRAADATPLTGRRAKPVYVHAPKLREVLGHLLAYAADCAAENDERPACVSDARTLLDRIKQEEGPT